jgi:hypothetical protein
MKYLALLLLLTSAVPAEAQVIDANSFERVYSRLGVGRDLGTQALWWTLDSSTSRWRLIWDLKRGDFSRFDLGFVPGAENLDSKWWVGFSFALPHSSRPDFMRIEHLSGAEGGECFLLGKYQTEGRWLELRYPLAETSDGVSWPWSVDLRELSFGNARCLGGELSGLLKAGYSSDTGGYAGVGLELKRGKYRLSYDTHDGPSVEVRTEITGW